MHIQLIRSVSNGPALQGERWYIPLGLVWLANYLKSKDYDVEILDEQILTEDEILRHLDAPLVGINFNITSTDSANRIAAAAKSCGSTVVFGGQAATPLAREILQTNNNVDYVIRNDGEKAMEMLARKLNGQIIALESIPNLAFRKDNEIVCTPSEELDLPDLPFPDRRVKGVSMEQYLENFRIYGTEERFNCFRPTNAYTRKGCYWRSIGQVCSFCARVDRHVRSKTAMQAYKEYRYLVEEFDVDYICDDSDNWINEGWLTELAQLVSKYGDLEARLRVYGDARDITPQTAALLKQIGVDAVLIGIESGDETILKRNGKQLTINHILSAAELLGKNDIRLCGAYVLGLIGESENSLDRTTRLASRLNDLCESQITYWNLMLPLPGSTAWKRMMQIDDLRKKYTGHYCFDIEEIRYDFVRTFCNLGPNGYQRLLEARNVLLDREHICVGEYLR